MSERNALVPLGISPGSKPLKHSKWEQYARYRAQALPRIVAFRKLGNYAANDKIAHNNPSRLEKRPGVKDRINYLIKQAEERIAEKRARIEKRLWSIHESNIQDFFETFETIERDHNGRPVPLDPTENPNDPNAANSAFRTETRVRPRLLTDLSPEVAALVEDVRVDAHGRYIPKLYSKLDASKELRAMLNMGKSADAADVTQLSDAELIAQLAQQAKELGIEIDLNYRFAQKSDEDE